MSPRFFCEHCGVEVPRNAKRCPGCGRYFASVKCPNCGFAGEEFLFKGGCPVCGYSAPSGGLDTPSVKFPPLKRVGPLPLWVYIVTLLAFILVSGAVYFYIR
jgi:rRNA maturation protein Nop10